MARVLRNLPCRLDEQFLLIGDGGGGEGVLALRIPDDHRSGLSAHHGENGYRGDQGKKDDKEYPGLYGVEAFHAK
jgi:hypothetical protein